MSDRSVSPFTVTPNINPATAPGPAPVHTHVNPNPPALPPIDDIDPDNDYLNDLRNPHGDPNNMFPQRTTRRQVPFTVASVLPRTDYKEEWEPKERRSDAYLAVQIQVLTYLSTHAADELTPAQAHFFTENAGTKPLAPTAKQAVELCYFMRSHGFDTYVKLDPDGGKIRLYVANRDFVHRGRDGLYWEQDMKTGEVKPMEELGPVGGGRGVRGARRGALAHIFEGTA